MNLFSRGLAVAALLALPLSAAAPMSLAEGISALPIADESRTGYARTKFKPNRGRPPAAAGGVHRRAVIAPALCIR